MRRIVLAAFLALAPLAAHAEVTLGIEGMLGAPHAGVQKAPGTNDALTAAGDFGADLLLRLGFVGLGAAFDRNVGEQGIHFTARSAMGGLMLDVLPMVRLELMGELGYAAAGGARLARFEGARPGLSFRVPKFPLRVGVWGLARWGLPDQAPGKPAYGALFRAGIEL